MFSFFSWDTSWPVIRPLGKVKETFFLIKITGLFILGPYTERIDLWFEQFFVKEIRHVIEWLREIKTAD